ncbi:hypothetical protein GOP47_0024585 [Adiantum capillus-veneris]|uniref:Uncharacterized protein n=1 Tax=Adiantum capillus-veneris TaxID=13818 RepID=A0A9D4U394_ADICA|nr:hypothetical protein GOP47_0024585 [Adiantum capillus-veneris]
MDAPPSASAMAGGWDINSSQPASAPALHFSPNFDIKPPIIDTQLKSHLNVGLASPAALNHSLGDYLATHGHRLMVGSNFGQHHMIVGLRAADPGYYMKEFGPRSEDIVSLFEQSRAPRRGDDDLAGANSPAGTTSLSAPAVADARFHTDADVSIACLPQFSSKLLPMLAMETNMYGTSDTEAKVHEEERGGSANDDRNEDGDNDGEDQDDDEEDAGGGDDDDDGASTWPGHTQTSGSVASKGMIVIRQAESVGGASPIACQDCGNQAKKDCMHMRCRTCCKSRGLACATHVKSTWVPAYKRRQRQHLFSNDNTEQPIKLRRSKSARAIQLTPDIGATSEAATATNSHTSTSTGTPPPSSDLNWLQQEGRLKRLLPAEAREQAVFKCVKISGINDGHEEFAYQTVVKIGGHIYKGMLYDHGIDKGQASASSIAELRLGGRNPAPSSSATIDLAGNLYGTSESVFLGGNNATH